MEVDLNERVCLGPAECVRETEKAWLVRRQDGSEIWFPRSQGGWARYDRFGGGVCFHASRWVLGRKGIPVIDEDRSSPPPKRAPTVRARARALGMRLIAGGGRK
jgi:hypothetical protein